MDPELLSTCQQGDVEKLRKLFEDRRLEHELFLAQENQEKKNILHILFSSPGKQECAKEALKGLPTKALRQLASQADIHGDNPLHLAASCGFPDGIVESLVDACKDLPSPTWIAKNKRGKLPVQVAVAEFLLSVNVDGAGSLLLDSVKKSRERTGALWLHRHREEVFKRQDSSRKMSIVSRAIENDVVGIMDTILQIDTSISYDLRNEDDENPLHIAVKRGRPTIARILVDAFLKYLQREIEGDKEAAAQGSNSSPLIIQEEYVPAAAAGSLSSLRPPWRQTDKRGITPLHLAFKHRDIKLADAAYLLSSDFAFLSCWAAHSEQVPQISFVKELEDSIEVTEPSITRYISQVHPSTFLRFIQDNEDETAKKLIKQHKELVQFKDNNGRAVLGCALDKKDVRTMKIILDIQPSAVNIQDDQQDHLLIKACKMGYLPAIQAICEACPEVDARGKNQTTPLHNVKLQNREEYDELLKINAIVRHKNEIDAYGRSPVIAAIECGDLHLAEALLDRAVDVMNGKNKDGKTAVAFLKEKSGGSPEWEKLYNIAAQKQPLGTDVKDIRTTLSVVAGLLTTITFAAAFTVPGGFDQANGDVILGRKPAFIIFILSDTYAMCCSMIALYALIWVAAQETNKALKLINFSIAVLNQSFYGTLGAFMTGVYTILSSKSLWVAIIVLVMCSTVMISAFMIIQFKLVEWFIDAFLSGKESFKNNIIKPKRERDQKKAESPV